MAKKTTFSVLIPSKRIDLFLVKLFPKLSRNYIQYLIEQKNISLNNTSAIAHKGLKQKDVISITFPELKTSGIIPANIPLDILYEDIDMLVLNKQAGIVVHPSDNGGHMSNSIVNALLYHCKDLQGLKGDLRPGIVHRLDKDTSGVLVVAKNDISLHFLAQQWEKRTVSKEYITLVMGHLIPAKGRIEAPLGRSMIDRKKMAVVSEHEGRSAVTEYDVITYYKGYSLLRVKILTGRTHQIRVHFKSIGFPVVGDTTYGNPKINTLFEKEYGLCRQFLHASKLGLTLPSTKKKKEFEAPLPKDLSSVLEKLEQ